MSVGVRAKFASFNIIVAEMFRERKIFDDWNVIVGYQNDSLTIGLVNKKNSTIQSKWTQVMGLDFIEKQAKRAGEILLEQVEKQINVHNRENIQV